MKEFKVAGYTKFLIGLYVIVLLCVLVGAFFMAPFDFIMIALDVILTIFGVYLFKVFIAINKDTFKKIVIDKASGKFLLMTAKKEVLAIPFENVAVINMTEGRVLKGIYIGHITIITRESKTYGVTISNIDKFYSESPNEIEKTFDDAIFYQPRWNNLKRR